jgi:hypothetical protein
MRFPAECIRLVLWPADDEEEEEITYVAQAVDAVSRI